MTARSEHSGATDAAPAASALPDASAARDALRGESAASDALPALAASPEPSAGQTSTAATAIANAITDAASAGPPASAPRRENGEAAERLIRLLYLAVGAGSIIFGALSVGPFLAQMERSSAVPAIVGWTLVFGLPVVLAVLSRRVPLRVLRIIAIVEGVVFLSILAAWLVWRDDAMPVAAGVPWVLTLTGIPSVVVAIIARARVAWGYAVLACSTTGLLRAVTSTDRHPTLVGVEDGLYTFLLVSVFVGLTLAARAGAARVDEAARTSRSIEASRAARVARKRERLTIDALVHDSVISTLLMAGLGRVAPAVVARQAARTLGQLDELRAPAPQRVVPHSYVVRRLEQLTIELAPDAAFRIESGAERAVPAAAVAALLGAVGEAIRNSMAAAGGGRPEAVARTVTVRSVGDGIQVLVHDNGVGFDRALVPAERLGIAQSILGRMDRIPGGSATVRSTLGTGTEVQMNWAPETPLAALAEADTHAPARVPANAGPARLIAVAATAVAATATTPTAATADALTDASVLRSFSAMVGISPRSLRAILVLFIGVHAVLAFANSVPHSYFPLESLAFLSVSGAAVWLTLSPGDGLSRLRAMGVLALCGVTAALMFFHISPVSARPFAHWHLGAITFVLLVLIARGRTGWAWGGYAVMASATIAWAVTNGLSVGDGVDLAIRHAGTLLAGTLFVVGLRRSARTLHVITRQRSRTEAGEATVVAAVEEREAHLNRVNALARPALERLARARSHGLDAAERAECLLVEASLRDAIRGRCLFQEPAIGAARAARARGVEVILLDDSGDTPPSNALVLALVRIVAAELDAITCGRLTARVLPAGRAELATIVVESAHQRMLLVAPDGTVRGA